MAATVAWAMDAPESDERMTPSSEPAGSNVNCTPETAWLSATLTEAPAATTAVGKSNVYKPGVTDSKTKEPSFSEVVTNVSSVIRFRAVTRCPLMSTAQSRANATPLIDVLTAAWAVHALAGRHLAGGRSLAEALCSLEEEIDREGLDVLQPWRTGIMARPRPFETAAVINRMRTLRILRQEG